MGAICAVSSSLSASVICDGFVDLGVDLHDGVVDLVDAGGDRTDGLLRDVLATIPGLIKGRNVCCVGLVLNGKVFELVDDVVAASTLDKEVDLLVDKPVFPRHFPFEGRDGALQFLRVSLKLDGDVARFFGC